jgi:hypothetical protein
VKEFYRISEENDDRECLMVIQILQISEMSRTENYNLTASFITLNRDFMPQQGYLEVVQSRDIFFFENQYLCVWGKFKRNIFLVNHVIPFRTKNVVDNLWNISEIESNSNGFISIKPNLSQIVNGDIADEDGYRRSLQNVIKLHSESIIEEENQLSQKKSLAIFNGPFFRNNLDLDKVCNKIEAEIKKTSPDMVFIRGPIISPQIEPLLLIKNKTSFRKLISTFKSKIENIISRTNIKKYLIIDSSEEVINFNSFPLQPELVSPLNKKEISTSLDEFKYEDILITFIHNDQFSRTLRNLKDNKHLNRAVVKNKIMYSLCEQYNRNSLCSKNEFLNINEANKAHLFGKKIDLKIICSANYTSLEEIGGEVVMTVSPFVTDIGFGQWSLITIGEKSGNETLSRNMKIEIMGV